jgi:hypothetical protein
MVRITSTGIQLPSWTDSASVVVFLTAALGIVITILGFVKPGLFGVAAQDNVRAYIPIAGTVIAAVAGWIQVHRVTSATKAVLASGVSVLTVTRKVAKAMDHSGQLGSVLAVKQAA